MRKHLRDFVHRAGQPARRSYLGGLVHPALFRLKRETDSLRAGEMAGKGKAPQNKQPRTVAELEAELERRTAERDEAWRVRLRPPRCWR